MSTNDYQGTYIGSPAAAYAGMVQASEFENIFSRQVETAAIAFGLAVCRGVADYGCKINGTVFDGIATADKTQTTGQYEVGATAGILSKGYVWVTSAVDIVKTDTVYFTAATGAITNVSSGNVAITGAKFINSATAGNPVMLFLG